MDTQLLPLGYFARPTAPFIISYCPDVLQSSCSSLKRSPFRLAARYSGASAKPRGNNRRRRCFTRIGVVKPDDSDTLSTISIVRIIALLIFLATEIHYWRISLNSIVQLRQRFYEMKINPVGAWCFPGISIQYCLCIKSLANLIISTIFLPISDAWYLAENIHATWWVTQLSPTRLFVLNLVD